MGFAHPDELLARIDSRQLTEWMAYHHLEPWGERQADLRMGIATATLANIHRDPKKRKKPFGPADFMPEFDKKARTKRGNAAVREMFRDKAVKATRGG